MALFNDLVNKYKGLLSGIKTEIPTAIRQSPIGYLSNKISPKVISPLPDVKPKPIQVPQVNRVIGAINPIGGIVRGVQQAPKQLQQLELARQNFKRENEQGLVAKRLIENPVSYIGGAVTSKTAKTFGEAGQSLQNVFKGESTPQDYYKMLKVPAYIASISPSGMAGNVVGGTMGMVMNAIQNIQAGRKPLQNYGEAFAQGVDDTIVYNLVARLNPAFRTQLSKPLTSLQLRPIAERSLTAVLRDIVPDTTLSYMRNTDKEGTDVKQTGIDVITGAVFTAGSQGFSDVGGYALRKMVESRTLQDLVTNLKIFIKDRLKLSEQEAEVVVKTYARDVFGRFAKKARDLYTTTGDFRKSIGLPEGDFSWDSFKERMKLQNRRGSINLDYEFGKKKATPIEQRKIGTTGRIVGAPGQMIAAQSLQNFRKRITASAIRGTAGKQWYEDSGKAILKMFGGDVDSATKFSQLLAIYSPATSVDQNFGNALKAWTQYQAGQPIKAGRFGWMDQAATNLLVKNVPWSGRKTNSFYQNIVKTFNPSEGGPVTVDMWIMRALGYKTDSPSPQQYEFAEREIKGISDKLGWSPEQTQAAIWMDAKAHALKKPVKDLEPRGFADAVEKNFGQLSWEAAPSKTSGLFPESHTAPWEQRMEFHVAKDKIFYDKDGVDLLAREIGLPVSGKLNAPGVFEGQVSPGTQFIIPMPKGHKAQGVIEPAMKQLLDEYSAARALYTTQDAVAYHRPFYDTNVNKMNGTDVNLGKPITPEQAVSLDKELTNAFGTDIGQISVPNGVRIVDFNGGLITNERYGTIKEIVSRVFGGEKSIDLKRFATDGNYISNDWTRNIHGEDYRRILQARRPDLLGRLDRLFSKASEDVNKEFAQKYGWTDSRPGKPVQPRFTHSGSIDFNAKLEWPWSKPKAQQKSNVSPSPDIIPQGSKRKVVTVKTPKITPTKVTPVGQKERGFVSTVREAPTTTKDVAKKIKGFYTPEMNKKSVEEAAYLVKTDHDSAVKLLNSEPWSARTSTVGMELMRQAQNAGRFDEAVQIAETIAHKATQAGQGNQALSIWARFTPEGMLKYAEKEMLSANKKLDLLTKAYRGVFGKGEIKFTSEDAKTITGLMKKANSTTNEKQRIEFIRQAFEYIGKKLPWGVSDVLDEFRYNNMLSNPLTHLRNIWSNMIQTYLTRPATLLAQGKLSDAVKYEAGTIKALPEAFSNFAKALKTSAPLQRVDEFSKMKPIKPKRLGKLSNIPSTALEGMDQFFTTLIKGGEMARGAKESDALQTAVYSLFRGDMKPEGQGFILNKIDDVTKAIYGLRKVGLGWFVPFLKTPMNVAKQWIEYSPLGVTTAIGSKMPKEQLAKALLGTIATAFGAKLALEGRTTWAAPTDEKAKQLFYDSGRKPYSVKVGDRWVPMQTFGVFAYALGIPAAVKYNNDESRTALTDSQLDKLVKNISSLAGFWSQQTFVSGLGSFVELASGNQDYTLPKNIAFTLGQLKPMSGLMRYVATVVDPVFRKPRSFEQQLVSDIPFMTQNLPYYENSKGEPSKRNETNYGIGGAFGIAPYGQGVENPEYESPYQARIKKLQTNAVKNQQKKLKEEAAQKGKTGVRAAEYTESADAPKTLMEKVELGMDVAVSDPIQGIKAILSGEHLRKVEGGTVIVERKLGSGDADPKTQWDHKVPLELGGMNNAENREFLTVDEHTIKTKMDNYLKKQVMEKKMSKEEAAKKALNWRNETGILPKTEQTALINDLATSQIPKIYTITDPETFETKTYDLSTPVEKPKLTGLTEVDKKLKSKYSTAVTKKINEVMVVLEDGQITAQEAEKAIQAIKNQSLSVTGKVKRGKKPSFKIAKVRIPKIKMAKIKKISIKKPKLATYKIKVPKIKKSKITKSAKIT